MRYLINISKQVENTDTQQTIHKHYCLITIKTCLNWRNRFNVGFAHETQTFGVIHLRNRNDCV